MYELTTLPDGRLRAYMGRAFDSDRFYETLSSITECFYHLNNTHEVIPGVTFHQWCAANLDGKVEVVAVWAPHPTDGYPHHRAEFIFESEKDLTKFAMMFG